MTIDTTYLDSGADKIKPARPAILAMAQEINLINGSGGSERIGHLPDGIGAVERTTQAKLREVVSPEDFGAIGDGMADDTSAFQNAAARIRAMGGGILRFGAGKTYKVLAAGGVSGGKLIDLQNCFGVRVEGNGARILTGNVTLSQNCFDLNACSNILIENLRFESGHAALDGSGGIDWIVASYGAKRIVLQNLSFQYGRVGFVAKGEYAGVGDDSDRVRDIVALNLTFNTCYYPLNFQCAGDNFFARAIYTRNCGRSYFPFNCHDHDVWIDSQQGGPFSDVLLKVYGSTSWYSRLENIKLVYNSTGRFAGAANQGADEAMVAMDFQLVDGSPAPCFIQNIDITFNVEPNGASRNQSLFVVRKYDTAGNADSTGSRGHQLVNLTLRGVARSLQYLLADSIRLFTRSPDNWAGEFAGGVHVKDMTLGNSGSQVAIAISGYPISGPCSIKRVVSDGTLSRAGTNGKQLAIEESVFNGFSANTQSPQPYTPVWTAASGNPSIGSGGLQGSYTVQGKLCTVQVVMSAGATTTFGSGVWSFSLPFSHSNDAIQSVGSAFALDSGTAFLSGACTVAQGSSTAKLILGGGAGNYVNSGGPFAWASGDFVRFQVTYPIA